MYVCRCIHKLKLLSSAAMMPRTSLFLGGDLTSWVVVAKLAVFACFHGSCWPILFCKSLVFGFAALQRTWHRWNFHMFHCFSSLTAGGAWGLHQSFRQTQELEGFSQRGCQRLPHGISLHIDHVLKMTIKGFAPCSDTSGFAWTSFSTFCCLAMLVPLARKLGLPCLGQDKLLQNLWR